MQMHAETLLKTMLGSPAQFRDGQYEALEFVVGQRDRALIVQRTGWGKSIVYFLATKLLRDSGAGVTLLISPLLALMRNQIEMAARIGIRAVAIDIINNDNWEEIEAKLQTGECDVLLFPPNAWQTSSF